MEIGELLPEHIGQLEVSQRTETSKYLEEKKSKEIPSVVASESGRAQTPIYRGVVGPTSQVLKNRLVVK